MKDIKVSIITPIYNAESTLRRCLDSLCRQTYDNVEFVLVDDGSKDRSLEICLEYADKDSRIRIHSQDNAGPSAARNIAIDLSTGDYLAFVDSDDYVELDMIECMVTAAQDNSADMVICSFYEEDGKSVRQHRYSHRSGYYDEEACQAIALDVIDNNSKTRIPPYSPIRLVRRSIFDDPSLRFNSAVKRSEDYLLWTQVHFLIKSMYLMGDAYLYHYMYNSLSITRSYLHGYWPMCKELYAELNKKLPQTPEIKKRLQAMLIQRSLVALHNSTNAAPRQFDMDFEEILNDRELIKAAWAVGLVKNSKRARVYATLVIFRLKSLIRRTFSPKVVQ